MFEPQPAALTTMASSCWPVKASMVRAASRSAVCASPACEARAPQQTRVSGTTTSQPLRARASAVRRLVPWNISSGMRQQSVEENGSHHPIPTVLWRRQSSGHLHHRSELDTRGAGRLAGPTVKALIDVRLESRVVEGHQSKRGFLDLPHASARAVAL